MRRRVLVSLLAFAALVVAPSAAPAWVARLAADGVAISGAVDVAAGEAGDALASGV